MEIAGGERRHSAGDDLFWKVVVVGCAVAKFAVVIVAHRPRTPVLQKKSMPVTRDNGSNVGVHEPLRKVGLAEAETQAQLPILVVAHPPKAAVRFDEAAVELSCGNLRHCRGGNASGDGNCQTQPRENFYMLPLLWFPGSEYP